MGDRSACGLRADGSVSCWGDAALGRLGRSDAMPTTTPQVVELPRRAAFVCGGYAHFCAVLDSGQMYCWGREAEGQFGLDDDYVDYLDFEPTPVLAFGGATFVSCFASDGATCALDRAQRLHCAGRDDNGQLGLGAATSQQRSPQLVTVGTGWTAVSVGQFATCGIRGDGELSCWGLDFGTTPVSMGGGFSSVSHDLFHGCGVRYGGELWCWGRNIEGQLGLGTYTEAEATPVRAGSRADWTEVSAGRFDTCGVAGGALLCAGANMLGLLGRGDLMRSPSFAPPLAPTPAP